MSSEIKLNHADALFFELEIKTTYVLVKNMSLHGVVRMTARIKLKIGQNGEFL